MLNDNLGKDIDVTKSKHGIKPNKIILKLGKLEAEYGYESWHQLTAKKFRKRDASRKSMNDANSAKVLWI